MIDSQQEDVKETKKVNFEILREGHDDLDRRCEVVDVDVECGVVVSGAERVVGVAEPPLYAGACEVTHHPYLMSPC